ncbi:MAG: PEP-CTERM sorting domain-containing protein [Gammaproteobacteria bacterium]|nr:MAG: PEP-CTERM sorting domain-containing protein [Gammaproteobacteria bacterium]
MNQRQSMTAIGSLTAGLLFSGIALGGTIQCGADINNNYMQVDDTLVSACLGSGLGNIGNGINDDFLQTAASAGYTDVSGSYSMSFSQSGGTPLVSTAGTWSIDPTFWDSFSAGAIGFKFGTGNTPDEWFVYSLESGATGGDWTFLYGLQNTKKTGGGLSHLTLYSKEVTVPEPGTIALLGLGLIGLGLARKSRKAA